MRKFLIIFVLLILVSCTVNSEYEDELYAAFSYVFENDLPDKDQFLSDFKEVCSLMGDTYALLRDSNDWYGYMVQWDFDDIRNAGGTPEQARILMIPTYKYCGFEDIFYEHWLGEEGHEKAYQRGY